MLWDLVVINIVGSYRQPGQRVKALFLRRPQSYDLGLIRTLVTLLRAWKRRFAVIVSVWWLRTSSKFTWKEVKRQPENLENGQILSG